MGGIRFPRGVVLFFDIVNEEEMRGRRRATLDAGANAYCDDLRTYQTVRKSRYAFVTVLNSQPPLGRFLGGWKFST